MIPELKYSKQLFDFKVLKSIFDYKNTTIVIFRFPRAQSFFRSIPKLIYSREFSDGLMVIPNEEDSLINHPDDVLGPLESYDEYGAYVPHQFVLRKEPQFQNRRSHMNFPNGRHEVKKQLTY